MKRRKQFQLFGQTIRVKYDNRLADKRDHKAEARFRDNTIILQPNNETFYRPEEAAEQTFYHELTHWILYMLGEDKDDNEKFVDTFAHLLHQALTTMEYEEG